MKICPDCRETFLKKVGDDYFCFVCTEWFSKSELIDKYDVSMRELVRKSL